MSSVILYHRTNEDISLPNRNYFFGFVLVLFTLSLGNCKRVLHAAPKEPRDRRSKDAHAFCLLVVLPAPSLAFTGLGLSPYRIVRSSLAFGTEDNDND
jgi:hypothetical protein